MFNFKKRSVHRSDDNLRIIDSNTPFAILESFRSLCTNILYLPIEDKCKKIVITSAVAGEGKTYLSINTAIVLAQMLNDKKVLLVDMDMRKSSIRKLFGAFDSDKYNGAVGLTEFLVGISETPNFIPTEHPNLHILFSGAKSLNPAGLINSTKMGEFFEICNEKYDYIIIDTSPITVVTDATLLEKHVNGYIISTRSEYSNVHHLSDVISKLNAINAQIFGITLTDFDVKKRDNHKKSYGYGYGYYYGYKDKDNTEEK